MSLPSILTLHPEGDLRFEVGDGAKGNKQAVIVCSRLVAEVSRPFRAMLYGPFAESKHQNSGPNWTIPLPEDDPAAFTFLMKVVHGKISEIPPTLTRDLLFRITILTDKYDMTGVLWPFADTWTSTFVEQETYEQGDEALIWVAWELGDASLFRKELTKVREHSHINAYGELVVGPWGASLADNPYVDLLDLNGRLSAQIAASRSDMNERLLSFLRWLLNKYPWKSVRRPNFDSQMFCLLGGRSLKELGVNWKSLPRAAEYEGCTASIREVLRALWKNRKVIEKVMNHALDTMPHTHSTHAPFVILTDAQKKHLAAQRLRSGVRKYYPEPIVPRQG